MDKNCIILEYKKGTYKKVLKGTTSKNNGDFYCLNCFHSFRTKHKLELHKNECQNKDFCKIVMPSEDTK